MCSNKYLNFPDTELGEGVLAPAEAPQDVGQIQGVGIEQDFQGGSCQGVQIGPEAPALGPAKTSEEEEEEKKA